MMTSQGFDTVTSIFKCNGSNTIKSLRLQVSFLHSWLWKQNGGQCDWAYGKVNELGG